jgi:hypothetical protein
MSTNIKLKRSAVSGRIPSTGDLALGELAINTFDGKLFMKKDDGTESIVDITSGGGGGGAAYTTGSTELSTTDADQVVDFFSRSLYRTVKYYVEFSTASAYQATELLLTHDGTTVYITEYATIASGSNLGTINSNISGENVRLLVTPVNTDTTVKFARIEVASTGGGGGGSSYTLPTASTTDLGGVKVDGTSITVANGVISAAGGGGGSSSFSNEYALTGTTTDATETEILIGGSTRIPVATDKMVNYIVHIAAKRTDTPGDYALMEIRGVATNESGTVSDVGSIYEIIVARTNSSYLVDARADDINKTLNIYVNGVSGHTISWKASAQTIEV